MRRVAIIVIILVVLGYGLFEARRILEGPQITIIYPQNGSATSTNTLVISGEAQNVAFLTINDAPAYADEEGYFTQVLSPPLGYTVVTVAATDRFGRRASKTVALQVVRYCINKTS